MEGTPHACGTLAHVCDLPSIHRSPAQAPDMPPPLLFNRPVVISCYSCSLSLPLAAPDGPNAVAGRRSPSRCVTCCWWRSPWTQPAPTRPATPTSTSHTTPNNSTNNTNGTRKCRRVTVPPPHA